MAEGSLNNYITNGFLNFHFHRQFFLDFLTVDANWDYMVDEKVEGIFEIYNQENIFQIMLSYIFPSYLNIQENFLYNMVIQNYIHRDIFETFEIADNFLNLYSYKLLFENNYNLVNIKNLLNYNYFYYLNVSFYINITYLFTDFLIQFNSYIVSITICILNFICFIFTDSFREFINMNLLEYINFHDINTIIIYIFYNFLDHCTYKITIVYYIYVIYFSIINIIILLFLKRLIHFIFFFKFQIMNSKILFEYLNILNFRFNLGLTSIKFEINKINFKFTQNPKSTTFFILLFIKRIKKLDFVFYFIKFIKNLIKILENIILFIINIFKKIFKINIARFLFYKQKTFINKQKNPFYKFFFDSKKFGIKKFASKEDKQYYELLKKQKESETLSIYWKYLQVFYYSYTYIMFIRFINIIIFSIIFFFKFLIFKFLKNIIHIWILTKVIHILIYYFLNIFLCIKMIIKHIYLKYIWYFYFKIKNNIIYFLNMFIHYKFFKFINRLFLYECYYFNAEMIDNFPYYSSKFIKNFFIWFDIILDDKKINLSLLKTLNLIIKINLFFYHKMIKFIILLLPFTVNITYNILLFQIKIYNILIKNNILFLNYNFFKITIVLFIINILFLINFYYYNFFFLFFIFICYTICHYIIIRDNINLINITLWYIGFYLFFIYDIFHIIFFKIIFIILKIIKYFIIYPFIFYIILFFFFNNPIIYMKFTYILRIFCLPLFNIIFFIINDLNNSLTLSIFSSYQQMLIFIYNDTFENMYTINKWLYYADGIYWQIYDSVYNWWIAKEINYNIFLYYTPFDYIWFEGLYAFEEIYNIYKYITHYFFLYIYISIIYYFWFIVYIISRLSHIFVWINYLTINEFIFYYIYISKIIYIILFKLYIYDYVYIYVPFYIMQPIYNLYISYYEYYFIIKHVNYYINIKNIFALLKIFLNLLSNLIINIFISDIINKFFNLLIIIVYIFFNIIKYIYTIIIIYIYLLSDILYNIQLIFIIKYIYIYTNIDFLLFDMYSKMIILKDSFNSSFRFPIEYFNKINNKKKYYIYFQKYYLWIKKERFEYLTDILTFDYSRDNLAIGRWKKKTLTVLSKYYISSYNDSLPKWYLMLNNQSHYNIKYLYFTYKIFKFRKFLILFPYLYYLFLIYYIFIHIISFFFIIKLYRFLFNYDFYKNKELYFSNIYAWDVLREEIINSNYKLIKNDNQNLYNYYFQRKKIYKKRNINYIFYNFIIIKNLINKGLKNKSYNNYKKYKSKFKFISKIKSKFFSFNNLIKKFTFDFKDLIIFKKYNWLYDVISHEEKKFGLFSSYNFENYKSMPFIYNHYYEEPFIDGSIKFNLNINNYNYLYSRLKNLYIFYKWVDKVFFNYRGSLYLFHKDPRVPFINKYNDKNTFYYNTSMDCNDQIYLLFIFIGIPCIVISTFLSSILHFTNEMDFQFYDIFYMHLTFWLSWFMTQFGIFHEGILKVIFSFMGDSIYMFALDNDEENILSHGDTEFHNWFNYELEQIIFFLYIIIIIQNIICSKYFH